MGKLGLGCGRFVVSEACLEGDEERMGNGDGVGSEGAELIARGVGISLDWGAFFILGGESSICLLLPSTPSSFFNCRRCILLLRLRV